MYGNRSAEHPGYDSVTQLYSDAPRAELGIAPLGILHPLQAISVSGNLLRS